MAFASNLLTGESVTDAVRLAVGSALFASGAVTCALGGQEEWPQWRGPSGNGLASCGAPTRWSDEENVRWAVALPGRGGSTPIAVAGRVLLTTAVSRAGTTEQDSEDGLVEHDFRALCFSQATGALLWERTLCTATPHEGHDPRYGSFASISPVTDGESVYVSFGSRGIYCLSLEGELLWEVALGLRMQVRGTRGEGSSPVLCGDQLVQLFDHEGPSLLVSLDKRTGRETWRVERDEATTWATPLAVELDGRRQLVVSGSKRVRGYAAETGRPLWECGGLGFNPIPTPVRFEDTALVMSGAQDPRLLSIELGGTGDLTGGERIRWSATRGLPYSTSPAVYEGRLFTVTDGGLLSCFDARTGAPHYLEQRLPRGSRVKSSPVVAGGKLYVATESGAVHVIEAGPTFVPVATNRLSGESFIASPAVAAGELLLRGRGRLFCIGDRPAPSAAPSGPIVLRSPGGSPGDAFGFSVSLSADVAVVGAQGADERGNNSGSASVFARAGAGWSEQARLLASDGAPGDFFGSAVSVSGETAAVGAPGDDDRGPKTGAAYVFVRSGSGWDEQAKLVPAGARGGDGFGEALAVHGDTLLVGAYAADVAAENGGSATVFVRDESGWKEQATLLASDAAPGAQFGGAVALFEDTAAVGATHDRHGVGSVYVFERAGSVWTEVARLSPADGSPRDFFGRSVALFEDRLLVGVRDDDDRGPESGSAHVYRRAGAAWEHEAKLLPADGMAGDHFGIAVGLSGTRAVVGARGNDQAGEDAGAAYLFARDGGAWTERGKLLPPGDSAGARFGLSVSASGDALLVGADRAVHQGRRQGAAFLE